MNICVYGASSRAIDKKYTDAAFALGKCLADLFVMRERIGEYIMLRFRLTAGLSDREFTRRFGFSFTQVYGKKMERYVRGGFATFADGVYALTPQGMFVSNYILSDLLDFEDLGQLNLFNGTK